MGGKVSKQKRDNEYYLKRLKNEHPSIYADYQAGKFKNVSQALVAAGLRTPKSGLKALESAWKNATPAERDAFKVMIGCTAGQAPPAKASPGGAVTSSATAAPAVRGRQGLPPALATDVRAIMARRGLKIGDVMREMGRNPLDTSLGMALSRDTSLSDDLLDDLRAWVKWQGAGAS